MWRLNNEKRTLFFFFVRSQLCVFGAFRCSHSSSSRSLWAFIILLPCFLGNLPIFSLFLPTLRDFPWEKVRERGERLQRTAAMLDLRQAAHGAPAWEAG